MATPSTLSLKVITANGLQIYPITTPESDDGISWDSAGNDAPHDGNGIGNHAGDHTDHGMTFEADRVEVEGANTDAQTFASFDDLLRKRASLRR